jgi:hypothetical protein
MPGYKYPKIASGATPIGSAGHALDIEDDTLVHYVDSRPSTTPSTFNLCKSKYGVGNSLTAQIAFVAKIYLSAAFTT